MFEALNKETQELENIEDKQLKGIKEARAPNYNGEHSNTKSHAQVGNPEKTKMIVKSEVSTHNQVARVSTRRIHAVETE